MKAFARLGTELKAGTEGKERTAVSALRSESPLMLRPTMAAGSSPFIPWEAGGPDGATVSLAASGAGPLGGDRLRLEVEVGPGSALVLREVSSTLLLPGTSGKPSLTEVDVRVAEGATFVWLPEPVIAAHGCRHRMEVRVELEPGARLLLREELVLGRYGEEPGDLVQRLKVRLDGRPLHDQELVVGPGAEGWSGPAVTGGHRALGSVVVVDPAWQETCEGEPSATPLEGDAALMPLAGPAAVLGALAPDTVELRRRLESGMSLLNREDRPSGPAWAEAVSGRDG